MDNTELKKLFQKVTGLTYDPEKLSAEKIAWLIPDGAMLDNSEGDKFQLAQELLEAVGLSASSKVDSVVESTADNDDPTIKPEGKGWKKVIDAEAVEGSEEYWTINGEGHYTEDPTYILSSAFNYIHDEESWNDCYENGGLHIYYEQNPSEDLWNESAHRAANFNDRQYVGTIDNEAVETMATWANDSAQSLVIGGETYYTAIFYDFEPKEIQLFTDIELSESAEKTFVITSIGYANCTQCWEGAINAPGAKYPWIVPYFTEGTGYKIIFKYEDKEDVKPWGDTIFGTGEGEKVWGAASVAEEFQDNTFLIPENAAAANKNWNGTVGEESAFDITKFQMVLEQQGVEHIDAVEAVPQQYHWERTVVKED